MSLFPSQPLASRVLGAQLIGLGSVMVLGWAAVRWGGLSARVIPAATLVFIAIAVLVLLVCGNAHPFPTFGPANVVTTFRAAVVAFITALIGATHTDVVAAIAAGLALGVTVLDGVDGWLARRTGLASAFGARFDMETDALLILVLSVLAWQHEKAGAWVVLAGAMRYLFVGAGYVWRWMNAPLPPSVRRKAVCVVQVVGLGVIVSPLVSAPASVVAAAVTLAALTWSFGVDVLWLRRQVA